MIGPRKLIIPGTLGPIEPLLLSLGYEKTAEGQISTGEIIPSCPLCGGDVDFSFTYTAGCPLSLKVRIPCGHRWPSLQEAIADDRATIEPTEAA